ncbi:pentapeptide repeat-containing protein [Francisella philomiragia]|uniref:pentapeptide repeat-containing protein n=1 Tax=Francisella philomiragia TaxID=28110 RepID=UPI001B8D587B|nr:pentapeptide repeat-containing protein [Francisella philomiragia]QUE31910.1 pentapeptide repeat-containing protein [Francisella philomiragia]
MTDREIRVHLSRVYYEDEAKKDRLVFELDNSNKIIREIVDGDLGKSILLSKEDLIKNGFVLDGDRRTEQEMLSGENMLVVSNFIFADNTFSIQNYINEDNKQQKFKKIIFVNCIFLCRVIFDVNDISIEFSNCFFKDFFNIGQTSKEYIEFDVIISFKESIFIKGIYTKNRSFKEKIVIEKSIFFLGGISFVDSTFENTISLNESIFNERVFFENTNFNGKSVFERVIFDKFMDFRYVFFKENVSFREAKFNQGLNLARINVDAGAILDFYDITVAKSSYEISNKEAQETARVLKYEAIKKNDSIKAVEHYKDECEYHYQSLKWSSLKDFFDKLILCFERNVSSYGTNPYKTVLIFLGFNLLFTLNEIRSLLILIVSFSLLILFEDIRDTSLKYDIKPDLKLFIYMIKILAVYIILIIICVLAIGFFMLWVYSNDLLYNFARILNPITSLGRDNISLLNIIHLIINITLIYEVQKSFRKYSRKL